MAISIAKGKSASIKFDKIRVDMGAYLPIHFEASVSLCEFSVTRIDSKPETANFWKSFCSSLYGMLKVSIFQGVASELISVLWVNTLDAFTALTQMSF